MNFYGTWFILNAIKLALDKLIIINFGTELEGSPLFYLISYNPKIWKISHRFRLTSYLGGYMVMLPFPKISFYFLNQDLFIHFYINHLHFLWVRCKK